MQDQDSRHGSYETRDILATGMVRFEGIEKKAPPQPDVERLSPRVVNILGMNPSPYTLNGTNNYLVGTGKRRLLIDSGEALLGMEPFLANLERTLKDEDCSIQMILLTHFHDDHYGGVAKIQARFGPNIPVGMIYPPEHTITLITWNEFKKRGLLELLAKGPDPYVYDDAGAPVSYNMDPDFAGKLPAWPDGDVSWDIGLRTKEELTRDYWWLKLNAEFVEAWEGEAWGKGTFHPLKHGDVIRTEGATLRVMHTPGHCENSATFVFEEEHALFSGDHVLGYGTTMFDELFDYMASLEAMLLYRPARLYPGHGPLIADGTGLIERYVIHRQAREDQVVAYMNEIRGVCCGPMDSLPLTAKDLAEALYIDTPEKHMRLAQDNVERVLRKLLREGRAVCFTDITRMEQANLPMKEYVTRLDARYTWDIREEQESSKVGEYQAFVKYIASALPASNDGGSTARL